MASFGMMNRFNRFAPKRQFEPDTTAQEAYQQHQVPEEDNPSIWRKIGAGLVGASIGLRDPRAGLAASSQILQEPHRRAMERYEAEEKALLNSAKLEHEQNQMKQQFESDMMRTEERFNENQALNQYRDQTIDQRRTEAEQRAADRAAVIEQRDRELERRKLSDQLLANYRKGMLGVAQQNAATNQQRGQDYHSFVGKYGQGQDPDKISALDQKRVRQLAVVNAMQDARFAKVRVGDDGMSFDFSKVDPKTQQEFLKEVAREESIIANRKKSDYTYPYDSSEVTDEDLEFERRLQREDEDDRDFFER